MEDVLINYLKANKGRPIKRSRLAKLLELTDGQMRMLLNKARKKAPICNLQDGRGYFIPKDKETMRRMIKQERHRANDIYRNVKVLEYYAK